MAAPTDQLRPLVLERRRQSLRRRLLPDPDGRHPGALHRERRDRRARRSRRAAAKAGSPPSTPCCLAPRSSAPRASGTARAAAPRRSSGSSAGRCARPWTRWRSASTPSGSTATCSRPTAAPAPPASPAAASRWPTPAPGWPSGRASPSPFGRLVAAVSVGVVEGEERLDLAYLEDRDADVDANVVMLRARPVRGGAGHRRARHLLPRPARPSPRSGGAAASPSSSRPSGRCSAGEAAGRHAERGEAAGDPPDPRAGRRRGGLSRRRRPVRGASRGPARDRRHVRGQCAPEGGVLRPPERPADGRRRLRTRGALASAARRGCARAAGPARPARRTEVDAANNAELLRRLARRAGGSAAGALSLRARPAAGAPAVPEVFEGIAAAGFSRRRAGTEASATTRSS